MLSSTILRECYATFVFCHGSFLVGMICVYPACLMLNLTNAGFDEKELEESLLGSIPFLMIGISTFFTTIIMGKGSRKTILRWGFIICMIGMSILLFAVNSVMILFGLMVASTVGSCFLSLVTTYIFEVSNKNRRASLANTAFLTVTFGYGTIYILASFISWRLIALVGGVVALSGFVQSFFIPESKYWYLLQKDVVKAKASLSWFEPKLDQIEIDRTIDGIYKIIEEDPSARTGHFLELLKNLRYEKYAKPFLLGIILDLFRASNGRAMYVTYLIEILRDLDISDDPKVLGYCFGVFDIVGSIIIVALIHKMNRKTVIYVSSMILIMCLFLTLVYKSTFNDSNEVPQWLVIAASFTFAVVINAAYNSSVNVLIAEIQIPYYRLETTCFHNGFLYLVTCIFMYLFPPATILYSIQSIISYFLGNLIISLIIIHCFFPETKRFEFYETEKTYYVTESTETEMSSV